MKLDKRLLENYGINEQIITDIVLNTKRGKSMTVLLSAELMHHRYKRSSENEITAQVELEREVLIDGIIVIKKTTIGLTISEKIINRSKIRIRDKKLSEILD